MKLYDLLLLIDSMADISVRVGNDPHEVVYRGRKDEFPLRLFDLLRSNVIGIDADHATKSYTADGTSKGYTVGVIDIYVSEV